MTPKGKAIELVNKFYRHSKGQTNETCWIHAKSCALIAVNELIGQCWDYRDIDLETSCNFWKEVKQEINNL